MLRLAIFDVLAWANVITESVLSVDDVIVKPSVESTCATAKSTLSPLLTGSICVPETLRFQAGLDASYLVSKSPVVTAVTWPWALVIIDLIYWPSCVPVCP